VKGGQKKGQAAHLPLEEGCSAHSAETVRFPAAVTPGVRSPDFFRAVGAVVNAGGPPDLKRLGDIMVRPGRQPV
jgi:hypothetical protein